MRCCNFVLLVRPEREEKRSQLFDLVNIGALYKIFLRTALSTEKLSVNFFKPLPNLLDQYAVKSVDSSLPRSTSDFDPAWIQVSNGDSPFQNGEGKIRIHGASKTQSHAKVPPFLVKDIFILPFGELIHHFASDFLIENFDNLSLSTRLSFFSLKNCINFLGFL